MPRYIEELNENITPASGDWLWIVDVSALATDQDRKLSVGKLALLATANVFTANQRVNALVGVNVAPTTGQQLTVKAASASTVGLVVDTAASPSVQPIVIKNNGVLQADIGGAAEPTIKLYDRDNGEVGGAYLNLGYNTNDSTPAGGFIRTKNLNGNSYSLWVDTAGQVRVHTAWLINSTDVAGTPVGAQISQLATKELLPGDLTPGDALRTMLDTTVAHFRYKNGAYNNSDFHGIVADWSPQFAMDAGRVFNPISAHGYTVQAVKALWERIQQLEQTIAEWSAD